MSLRTAFDIKRSNSLGVIIEDICLDYEPLFEEPTKVLCEKSSNESITIFVKFDEICGCRSSSEKLRWLWTPFHISIQHDKKL